ncbi:MAG TPA: hypothetical protein VGJ20_04345 [Xanthobacteraceae bacterium]
MAGHHVLAIQDTTERSYRVMHAARGGLGTVGNGTEVSLFLHPTWRLMLKNGHCLGLIVRRSMFAARALLSTTTSAR